MTKKSRYFVKFLLFRLNSNYYYSIRVIYKAKIITRSLILSIYLVSYIFFYN